MTSDGRKLLSLVVLSEIELKLGLYMWTDTGAVVSGL